MTELRPALHDPTATRAIARADNDAPADASDYPIRLPADSFQPPMNLLAAERRVEGLQGRIKEIDGKIRAMRLGGKFNVVSKHALELDRQALAHELKQVNEWIERQPARASPAPAPVSVSAPAGQRSRRAHRTGSVSFHASSKRYRATPPPALDLPIDLRKPRYFHSYEEADAYLDSLLARAQRTKTPAPTPDGESARAVVAEFVRIMEGTTVTLGADGAVSATVQPAVADQLFACWQRAVAALKSQR